MTDTSVRLFESPLGGDLRVLSDESGALHFVASDVAKQLGYRDAANMTRNLEDYERGTHEMSTTSGPQQMSTITESGLYTAALRSRRPEAEPFKRWVTEEVLPTIRRTGGAYVAPGSEAELALRGDPYGGLDLLISTATALRDERDKRARAEAEISALTPKAVEYDNWQASDSGVHMVEFAKALGLTQNKAYELLREMKVLFRQKDGNGRDFNVPKAGFEPLFRMVRERIGNGTYINVPLVTPEGEVKLRRMIVDSGRVPHLNKGD